MGEFMIDFRGNKRKVSKRNLVQYDEATEAYLRNYYAVRMCIIEGEAFRAEEPKELTDKMKELERGLQKWERVIDKIAPIVEKDGFNLKEIF